MTTSIKIREDVFQSIINGDSAIIGTFKGENSENYHLEEKNGGVPYREFVIVRNIDESIRTANVTVIATKVTLADSKESFEVLADDAIDWKAVSLHDGQANNLIKE